MKSTPLRSMLALAALVLSTAAAAAPDSASRSTLRIRLMEQFTPREATVTVGRFGAALHETGRTGALLHLQAGDRLELSVRAGEVYLVSGRDRLRAESLHLEQLGPGELTISAAGQQRSYTGNLVVSVEGGVIKLVNHVALEEYVASVVASEYGLDDLEGSKAMAVVARTYGLKVMNRGDDSFDHVDHTASQVYRGTREITPLARRAAEATRGEVLTHGGRLIEAVYFSSSGGHTANNEDVWQSEPHPYLRGRKDPWDRVSPNHEWEFSISESALHAQIRAALGMEIESIEVGDRAKGGRVISVKLVPERGRTRSISGEEFRRIVREALGERSLRSTKFEIRQRRGSYHFQGGGFGHGVGMSQWGAHGMAEAGKGYREILAFYYADVRLERRASEAPAGDSNLLAAATPRASTGDALSGRYMPATASAPAPTGSAPEPTSTDRVSASSSDGGRAVRGGTWSGRSSNAAAPRKRSSRRAGW